jgi:hypothetical protein
MVSLYYIGEITLTEGCYDPLTVILVFMKVPLPPEYVATGSGVLAGGRLRGRIHLKFGCEGTAFEQNRLPAGFCFLRLLISTQSVNHQGFQHLGW